ALRCHLSPRRTVLVIPPGVLAQVVVQGRRTAVEGGYIVTLLERDRSRERRFRCHRRGPFPSAVCGVQEGREAVRREPRKTLASVPAEEQSAPALSDRHPTLARCRQSPAGARADPPAAKGERHRFRRLLPVE